MIVIIGELAALGTAVCWSFTSAFFTLAGRQVGSAVVNRTRLIVAIGLLMFTHWLILGVPLPVGADPQRWFWLGVSAILGLVLGDAFLFQAFVLIGPRLSMLLMSLVPVISTLLAWVFLGERLTAIQLLAIGITVVGVAWVVLDKTGAGNREGSERNYVPGILFGLGGAAGQALGLVTAKQGLTGDFSALSGTLMRMLVAALMLWGFGIARRQVSPTWRQLRTHPQAVRQILGGSFVGPFLGVTLSLVAVQSTAVGVAATLMALPPIFLIPISRIIFHEQVGRRAIAGTFVAIAGVALLLIGG